MPESKLCDECGAILDADGFCPKCDRKAIAGQEKAAAEARPCQHDGCGNKLAAHNRSGYCAKHHNDSKKKTKALSVVAPSQEIAQVTLSPIMELKPVASSNGHAPDQRTLWCAKLLTRDNGKQDRFFRASDSLSQAAQVAQQLLDQSPAAEMTGAEMVSLERVVRLWN